MRARAWQDAVGITGSNERSKDVDDHESSHTRACANFCSSSQHTDQDLPTCFDGRSGTSCKQSLLQTRGRWHLDWAEKAEPAPEPHGATAFGANLGAGDRGPDDSFIIQMRP